MSTKVLVIALVAAFLTQDALAAKTRRDRFAFMDKHATPMYGRLVQECPYMAEPMVPRLPSWADARDGSGAEPLIGDRRAWVKEQTIVIYVCESDILHKAIDATAPGFRQGERNPSWRIFFHCGAETRHKMTVQRTIEFGNGSETNSGEYSLVSLDRNVEINGGRNRRVMRIFKNAHVLLSGLTIADGFEKRDPNQTFDSDVSWSGAGVRVQFEAGLTAHYCRFLRNKSLAESARRSGGGAIQAETGSSVDLWRCRFENNKAAVGGAIQASSVRRLYIYGCKFIENVANCGFDDRKDVLCRGGAVRVDSVEGHDTNEEHVAICESEFQGNQIVASEEIIAKIGASVEGSVGTVKAAGSAITMWNSEGNLERKKKDKHFMTMQGCRFKYNKESASVPGKKAQGEYVAELRGAGHIHLLDLEFSENEVEDAVLVVDNSDRFGEPQGALDAYLLTMKNVRFWANRHSQGVVNMDFHASWYRSLCTFEDVQGYPDLSLEDCRRALPKRRRGISWSA